MKKIRRALHFLRFGRKDLPPDDNRQTYITVKQIANLTNLTVNQINVMLNKHDKVLRGIGNEVAEIHNEDEQERVDLGKHLVRQDVLIAMAPLSLR